MMRATRKVLASKKRRQNNAELVNLAQNLHNRFEATISSLEEIVTGHEARIKELEGAKLVTIPECTENPTNSRDSVMDIWCLHDGLSPKNKPSDPGYATIEEEDQDDLVPVTPPPRQHVRQSIGQWSQERARKNMSVRSMAAFLEKKTGPNGLVKRTQ